MRPGRASGTSRHGHRIAALCTLLLLLLSACTSTSDSATPLPPVDAADIESLYAEQLAQLGFRLTDRGGLVDEDFVQDPEATHLSLYVTPLEELPPDVYAQGIVDVTAIFASDVFDRWSDLASFDVCQERLRDDPAAEAPALTQVTLSRDAAASVDWSTATVDDVVTATRSDRSSTLFILDDDVRAALR